MILLVKMRYDNIKSIHTFEYGKIPFYRKKSVDKYSIVIHEDDFENKSYLVNISIPFTVDLRYAYNIEKTNKHMINLYNMIISKYRDRTIDQIIY